MQQFVFWFWCYLSFLNEVRAQAQQPQLPTPHYVDTGISRADFKDSLNSHPAGFVIRKEGFFRYAFDRIAVDPRTIPAPPVGFPLPKPKDYIHLLDVDYMEKYYVKQVTNTETLAGTNNDADENIFMDTDFQMLEWPGKKSSQQRTTVEAHLKEKKTYCPSTGTRGCKAWMLMFDRDNGKIEHYPCNAQEGTNIVALASIRTKGPSDPIFDPKKEHQTPEPDNADDIELPLPQKIWLSHGTKSIYTKYVQPMFVPEKVLTEMARRNGEFCLGVPDSPPQAQSTLSKATELSDLRTVHDFTFTRGRLILGMKCGILIVSGLTKNHLTFEVASLRMENGTGKNNFSEPINKVSASVCCSLTDDCSTDQGIVAAYSFNPDRALDDNKFLYVSFDRGTLFEKKLIASKYAPINLIVGLYKLYREWHQYYELMNNPDTDDIMQDLGFVKNLREKPLWKSSPTDGKEKLFGVGVTIEERKKTTLQKVAEILHDQVPQRRQRLVGSVQENLRWPRWVQKIFNASRNLFKWKPTWTDETCESNQRCNETFVNDSAVDWLLHEANIMVKTPIIKENETNLHCLEITSILVIPEERLVLGICRVNHTKEYQEILNKQDPPPPDPPGPADAGFFAFFKFPLHTHTPLTHAEYVSQRRFYCKFIHKKKPDPLDPDPKKAKKIVIQPELIRIPGSVAIFVINCEGLVYVTTNFGTTLFNAAFYYNQDTIKNDCETDTAPATNQVNQNQDNLDVCGNEKESNAQNDGIEYQKYVRSFYLCALNVPPVITADRLGAVIVMTFGRFYARGAIAYNRETRFLVGESLEFKGKDPKHPQEIIPLNLPRDWKETRRFDNMVFPGLNTNGDTILALSMARVYSLPNFHPDTKFRYPLYQSRSAIRLVPMPFELYDKVRAYQSSNQHTCINALEKGYAFSPCQTISFHVAPRELAMDFGDTKRVEVTVKDDNPYLPLWIFSSNGNSVEVNATLNQHRGDRSALEDDLSSHHWDVKIRIKPNQKDIEEGEHLIDAFFGSDYNRQHDYSSQLSLVNVPNFRCHVQPTATVDIEIGCKGKKLVAHEDSYRPQCDQFKGFNYTIKQGEFDPALANFWISKESDQDHPYIKLLPNGDLNITYDYASWGCPLEPYVIDKFLPDLRIVEEGATSTKGEQFKGKFILIEIFGAIGYSYSKKIKDSKLKDCKRKPAKLKDYIEEWKIRQRLFKIATERLVFPARGINLATVNWLEDVRGNKILHNNAIKEHINIWNRANNIDCNQDFNETFDKPMSDSDLEESYEILKMKKDDDDDDDDDSGDDDNGDGVVDDAEEDDDDKLHWRSMVRRAEREKLLEESGDEELELDLDQVDEKEEDDTLEENKEKEDPNRVVWDVDRQRVYLFLAVAIDEYDSLCNFQTIFGVSLRSGALDISDLYSFLIFFIFVLIWVLLMITGYYIRRSFLRVSYIKQARMKKLEQAAWNVVYRYEKMLHDQELQDLLYAEEEGSADEGDHKKDDKDKAEKVTKTKSKKK